MPRVAATASQSISDPDAELTIVQAEGLGYFDGRLNEILIYDEALNALQVTQLNEVPELSTLALTALGLLGLLGWGWRRRR